MYVALVVGRRHDIDWARLPLGKVADADILAIIEKIYGFKISISTIGRKRKELGISAAPLKFKDPKTVKSEHFGIRCTGLTVRALDAMAAIQSKKTGVRVTRSAVASTVLERWAKKNLP